MLNDSSSVNYAIKVPFGQVILTLHDDALSIKLTATAFNPFIMNETVNQPLFNIVIPLLQDYFTDATTALHISNFLPIETLKGTPYQKRVWTAISNIPAGQVRSYSDIAALLNSCPRAVANACGANLLPIFIPCHRVVAKNGMGGFMRNQKDGLMIKQWLLNHEGVVYE